MELDTGSAVSLITHELYMKKFNEIPLRKAELVLKPYTGENITPVGMLKANVEYKGQAHFHKAQVVPYAFKPNVEEELRRLQNAASFVCKNENVLLFLMA